jgi:RNA polymerase sigma-70 factor (ECF subfamily)
MKTGCSMANNEPNACEPTSADEIAYPQRAGQAEPQLRRRVRAGDTNRANIGDDMLRHVPCLRRYARTLVSNRDHADDLVQDTLERGLRYASRFRPDSDLQAWLLTIMHNVFVDGVSRSARAGYAVPVDEKCVAEFGLTVEATQANQLEVRDLGRSLLQLPPEQRQILLMVVLEDMSYVQVAEALKLPLGTVMSRLSRARGKLRALLSRDHGSLPVAPSKRHHTANALHRCSLGAA